MERTELMTLEDGIHSQRLRVLRESKGITQQIPLSRYSGTWYADPDEAPALYLFQAQRGHDLRQASVQIPFRLKPELPLQFL